jgi:hypothetical protein
MHQNVWENLSQQTLFIQNLGFDGPTLSLNWFLAVFLRGAFGASKRF